MTFENVLHVDSDEPSQMSNLARAFHARVRNIN